MGWQSVLWLVIRFLLGRLSPQSQASDDAAVQSIAQAAHAAEPRLNVECLAKVLPGFLSDLAAAMQAGGLNNPRQLIDVALTHVVALVRCQFQLAQADTGQLQASILKCGISAGVKYFQTRDVAAAIGAFFSCVLSSVGGGNGTTPPPTNPSQPPFVGTPIQRCQ